MFKLTLILLTTSFSGMVYGGACGKADGINRAITIRNGLIIKASHPFINVYRRVGGIITGIAAGAGSPGSIKEYRTRISRSIGADGKKTGIGKNRGPGMLKA